MKQRVEVERVLILSDVTSLSSLKAAIESAEGVAVSRFISPINLRKPLLCTINPTSHVSTVIALLSWLMNFSGKVTILLP